MNRSLSWRVAAAVLLFLLAIAFSSRADTTSFQPWPQRTGIRFHRNRTITHFRQSIRLYDTHFQDLPLFFERGAVQVDAAGVVRRRTSDPGESRAITDRHPMPSVQLVEQWANRLGFHRLGSVSYGWLRLDGLLHPVVRVAVRDGSPDKHLAVYLDASNGRILETDLPAHTAVPPKSVPGRVYSDNPVTTPTPIDVPLTHLEAGADRLIGAYAHVATCVDTDTCDTFDPIAVRDPEEGFLFAPSFPEDPEAADPFAEVNAYRNVTDISHWIREVFGWNGVFGDETWIQVKVGRDWNNAAYYSGSDNTPPYIVFGVKDQNFAYDADTAYHEFGHAINDLFWLHSWMSRDAFGIDVSMDALEEALADIWSFSFSGDPVANAYITGARRADNGATCPRSLVGEGHLDSRVISGFAWDLRAQIGGEALAHIVYRSLAFLGREATFSSFVEALMRSARDLADENVASVAPWYVDVIQETARDRGLLDAACRQRRVPFPGGSVRYAIGYGRNRTRKVNSPFGFQWEIRLPASNLRTRLALSWYYPETTDDGAPVVPGYRVHIRKGTPVSVAWVDQPAPGEDGFTVEADETVDGAPTLIEFPYIGRRPLETGDTVYVMISAETDEPVIVVRAELSFVEETLAPPPGSGSGVDAPHRAIVDGTGCAFAATSSPTKPGVIALLASLFHSWYGSRHGENARENQTG